MRGVYRNLANELEEKFVIRSWNIFCLREGMKGSEIEQIGFLQNPTTVKVPNLIFSGRKMLFFLFLRRWVSDILVINI